MNNVDELHLTQHGNTWEVYVGTTVNPADQQQVLWDNIYVKQVVAEGGLMPRDNTRIKDSGQKYYKQTTTDDTASPAGEPAGNYAALHIGDYTPAIDWSSWLEYLKTHGYKEDDIPYAGYGHNPCIVRRSKGKPLQPTAACLRKALPRPLRFPPIRRRQRPRGIRLKASRLQRVRADWR